MIGWVVLSKTRVELTPDSLRAHLDRIYRGLFLPPQELRTFVVEGPVLDAQFLIEASVPGSAGPVHASKHCRRLQGIFRFRRRHSRSSGSDHRLNNPMISALARVLKCRLKPTTAADVSAFTSSLSALTANTVNR